MRNACRRATGSDGCAEVWVEVAVSVRAAADALVENGSDWAGTVQPGGYAVLTGGVLAQETFPLPTADLQPTLATPGAPLALSVSGAANGVQFAFWSPTLGLPTTLAAFTGSLALPIAQLRFFRVVATEGNGIGSVQTIVRPSSSLAGATFVVQMVEVGPSGLLFSNPTTLAIR